MGQKAALCLKGMLVGFRSAAESEYDPKAALRLKRMLIGYGSAPKGGSKGMPKDSTMPSSEWYWTAMPQVARITLRPQGGPTKILKQKILWAILNQLFEANMMAHIKNAQQLAFS